LAHFPKHVIEFAQQKASELEDYQSVTGTEMEGDDEPAAKKRKLAEQEGKEIISEFLSQVKQLPLTTLSSEKALEELNKLKEGVRAKNNTYVDDVLARGS